LECFVRKKSGIRYEKAHSESVPLKLRRSYGTSPIKYSKGKKEEKNEKKLN